MASTGVPHPQRAGEGVSFVLPGTPSAVQQMVAALPGLLWTANARGMLDFVSPQWVSATGRELSLLLGAGWLQSVHADDREATRAVWQQALDTETALMTEFRLCHAHGGARWFSMRATPIMNDLGQIDRWFGLCVDVDEFRQTQRRLQDSEHRYAVLFENKTNGVVQLKVLRNANGSAHDVRIEKINETYTRILGLSREQCEGRLLSEVFPGIAQADIDYVSLYGQIAAAGGEASYETYLQWSSQWLRVYVYSAQPDECIAIFNDISAQKAAETALHESERQLRLIIDHLAEGLIVSAPDGKSLHWNQKALALHGYTMQEERVKKMAEIASDYQFFDGAGQLLPFSQWPLPRLLRSEPVEDLELTLCNIRDHWQRELSYGGVLVRDSAGKPLMALLTIRDISERRRAEQARADAERRLRMAVDIAHLGFWEWSVADDQVYFSPQWKQLLGYTETTFSDRLEEWSSRVDPADRDHVIACMQAYLRAPEEPLQLEYRIRHRDGQYRWMAARAIADLDEHGKVCRLIGTMRDITEQKQVEQRVREAAQHDALTGLPNRALILEYASHLLAAADRKHSRGALLFIDLDRFKPVNDLYGHEMGDRLLREVARRMIACVRQEDLIGRIGGDEFVIVLPYLGKGYTAPTVARHVIAALNRPFIIDDLHLSISASIGISFYPSHGMTVDALLHRADLAMYHAKSRGRGDYQVFNAELSQREDVSTSIEARIKQGLSSNQLQLVYQPVIDLNSGGLAGVEALLRLPESTESFVGPDRFIPIAESAGMISQIGDWVVREICHQHRAWKQQGLPPLTIAMNVSPLQFRQRGFARRLIALVQEAQVDPHYLQIEVTENTVMERIDDAIAVLSELHHAGIGLALDDLGTGCSSLRAMSQLPLDKLKIDQSFVQRLSFDKGSQAVTDAIIAMGRALQLEIVGEGIESLDALNYLRAHGCRQVQGHWFSQPLSADRFVGWYRGRYGQHDSAARPVD